jgi:Arc/MetJ-type ribon-helix-helix transcriptional regulator
MNESLPPNVLRAIERRIRSGNYRTKKDVLIAAMESLDQHERLATMSAAELRAIFPGIKGKIVAGMKDARAGRLSDGEIFFDEQAQRLKHKTRKVRTA